MDGRERLGHRLVPRRSPLRGCHIEWYRIQGFRCAPPLAICGGPFRAENIAVSLSGVSLRFTPGYLRWPVPGREHRSIVIRGFAALHPWLFAVARSGPRTSQYRYQGFRCAPPLAICGGPFRAENIAVSLSRVSRRSTPGYLRWPVPGREHRSLIVIHTMAHCIKSRMRPMRLDGSGSVPPTCDRAFRTRRRCGPNSNPVASRFARSAENPSGGCGRV